MLKRLGNLQEEVRVGGNEFAETTRDGVSQYDSIHENSLVSFRASFGEIGALASRSLKVEDQGYLPSTVAVVTVSTSVGVLRHR